MTDNQQYPNVIAMLACVLFVSGCTTTIKKHYSAELSQIKLGDSVDKLKTVFPDVYLGGVKNNVEVYFFEWDRYDPLHAKANQSSGRVSESLQFYFADGKLTSWGSPVDWRADTSIDLRHTIEQK